MDDGGAGGATARNRTTADVVRDILADAEEIIRSEVRLAKLELREEAVKAGKAAGMLAAAAGAAFYAAWFLLAAVMFALAIAIPLWAAALLVGLALGVAAVWMGALGRDRVRRVSKPQKTVQSIKESVEWARRQMR
jgi:Flp pilus assembly protein TadB